VARRRGVVLDRDGTIVDVVRDAELGVVVTAFHPAQLRLLPGALDGMRRLADAGFALAIATNQPGAAKGQIPLRAIERTNRALVELLREAGVPIARDLDLDAPRSWMIGDAASDIAAAHAAGMRGGLLMDPRRCELCPLRSGPAHLRPDRAAPRLDLLADAILEEPG
jgi:D-glycero-D-manno-heptose 1,7-bisphosphate phosphatase